jgi:hypothetical protein
MTQDNLRSVLIVAGLLVAGMILCNLGFDADRATATLIVGSLAWMIGRYMIRGEGK